MTTEIQQASPTLLKTLSQGKDSLKNCYRNYTSNSIDSSEMEEVRKGHWTHQEHMLYIMFLDYFDRKFLKRQNRRLWKIFKLMSKLIQTRGPNQCRSHHQKIERNYKSIRNIVDGYKEGFPDYQIRYKKIKCLLAQLNSSNSVLADNETLLSNQSNLNRLAQIRNQNYQKIQNQFKIKMLARPKKQKISLLPPVSMIEKKPCQKIETPVKFEEQDKQPSDLIQINVEMFQNSIKKQHPTKVQPLKKQIVKSVFPEPIIPEPPCSFKEDNSNPLLTNSLHNLQGQLKDHQGNQIDMSLWSLQFNMGQAYVEFYLQTLRQYFMALGY